MLVKQIIDQLEQSDTAGADAYEIAKVCFLDWALGLEGEATTTAARLALQSPAAQNANSEAASVFVSFLTDAIKTMPHATPRRRRSDRTGRGLYC